jgi:spore coat protein U-like protein
VEVMMKMLLIGTGAAACVLLPGLAMAGSASFTVSATTQPAISVSCSEDLNFGTVSVEPNNNEGTITVDANSSATASGSNSDVYPATSESGPAACTITNSSDSDATAQLSATSTSTSGAELSDIRLTDGDNSLSADIMLGKASGIGNETVYIGGILTIPADHVDWGTYSETITLTVTE